MKQPIELKTVEFPKGEQYHSPTTYDDIQFPNNNCIEDHDMEEDFKNKFNIEKTLYYLPTEDDDDEQGTWNAPTRYQSFVAKCQKYIPYCIPDSKVLKISKAQSKTSQTQFVVIDIRVLDAGAFSTPVNLKVIRNPAKGMDNIVQTVIRHFIKAIEIKRRTMLENATKAVEAAQKMEGPSDSESIVGRAMNLLMNKKK